MRILLTIILTIFASQSAAEPSSEVDALMGHNLTIFDWGMFRVERELIRADIDATVGYLWDENQVMISVLNFSFGADPKTMEQTKTDCEEVFAKIDEQLWIKNGNDLTTSICAFCNYFSHNGWTSQNLRDAQNKIKNRLYYSYSDGSNRCTRKAYGTSIAVSSFN